MKRLINWFTGKQENHSEITDSITMLTLRMDKDDLHHFELFGFRGYRYKLPTGIEIFYIHGKLYDLIICENTRYRVGSIAQEQLFVKHNITTSEYIDCKHAIRRAVMKQ